MCPTRLAVVWLQCFSRPLTQLLNLPVTCCRSIKLGDPTISHYDSTPSTPQNLPSRALPGGAGRGGLERGASLEAEQGAGAGRGESGQSDTGVSVYEELQNMRRQIAKMNHRLMAVELENQQQQQREMVNIAFQCA